MSEPIIPPDRIGDAWPAVEPGEDPVLYGHATLTPRGEFEVRSLQTFELSYTAGRYGIDDTGSIRVVFRALGDWGQLQTSDPTAPNYVTARTTGEARLRLAYQQGGHQRPWWRSLTVWVAGGFLREGDTITVVFGDTSKGSPGMTMQTFCEEGFEFNVLADVCAVGHYVPLVDRPYVSIVPGQPHEWKAVLPSLRRPGERFRLGLKCEDAWGNPTPRAAGRFHLQPTIPVRGLPSQVDYPLGEPSITLDNLSIDEPGELRIVVVDDEGVEVAEAGPLVIRHGSSGYWGDLHGQSGESIGVTTARQYFDFARNKAFLDVTGHQANDFQVNNSFWAHLNELTSQFHDDGRFVVFPGYEWSGNTGVGGDRNVFFHSEGRQIHRSSHALLPDRSDIHTDAPTAAALFEALRDEDCVVYAHVGGRYADTSLAHDPRLETAMEIHSAWGTFEWLLTDGFALGHRCGVVCNSDGHKGRPGASYPGVATFGAYGGLTCFLTDDLSRDGIFECLRRRHHYGTTGARMHLGVTARFDQPATVFHRDPNAFDDPPTERTTEAMMGDIVQVVGEQLQLEVEVATHAPIERIEVRNATEVLRVARPYAASDLGDRIRVLWAGAEYRGRGRQSRWVGTARFDGCSIDRLATINAWNPERLLRQVGSSTIEFDAVTTGNFGGFDAWLQQSADATLTVACNHGNLKVPLSDIGVDDHVLDTGGLERQLRVFRMPERGDQRTMTLSLPVEVEPGRDNPIWVCVTTEDGFQAWSSPIFAFR
ncbi:MAG: DUF3604 domain-containing protein [Acidimicrobiales bacterium]